MSQFSIVACETAGAVGALFTTRSLPTWYAALRKPGFNPPNWLFGPVWTALYACTGVTCYLAGRAEDERVRPALALFRLQLLLNVLWTYIFFGRRAPRAAFLEILALWLAILFTIRAMGGVSRAGALLLIPYLARVSFAAALNLAIWCLNREPSDMQNGAHRTAAFGRLGARGSRSVH